MPNINHPTAIAELTAIIGIGSGDLLGIRSMNLQTNINNKQKNSMTKKEQIETLKLLVNMAENCASLAKQKLDREMAEQEFINKKLDKIARKDA